MQKFAGRALSAICFAILLFTLPAISGGNPSNRQADVIHTSRGDLRIMPVYHGSVMLEFERQGDSRRSLESGRFSPGCLLQI